MSLVAWGHATWQPHLRTLTQAKQPHLRTLMRAEETAKAILYC
jgi:hypothetical protein